MSDRIFWGIRNTGIGLIVLSCLMAIALLMGGCSTYRGNINIDLPPQNETAKVGNITIKIEIQNKNIPVTTDATIPAGALGL